MWRGKANLTFSSSLFAFLGRTTKMSSADTPSHNESAEDESFFEQTENEVAGVPVKQCVPTRISSSGAGITPLLLRELVSSVFRSPQSHRPAPFTMQHLFLGWFCFSAAGSVCGGQQDLYRWLSQTQQ